MHTYIHTAVDEKGKGLLHHVDLLTHPWMRELLLLHTYIHTYIHTYKQMIRILGDEKPEIAMQLFNGELLLPSSQQGGGGPIASGTTTNTGKYYYYYYYYSSSYH